MKKNGIFLVLILSVAGFLQAQNNVGFSAELSADYQKVYQGFSGRTELNYGKRFRGFLETNFENKWGSAVVGSKLLFDPENFAALGIGARTLTDSIIESSHGQKICGFLMATFQGTPNEWIVRGRFELVPKLEEFHYELTVLRHVMPKASLGGMLQKAGLNGPVFLLQPFKSFEIEIAFGAPTFYRWKENLCGRINFKMRV